MPSVEGLSPTQPTLAIPTSNASDMGVTSAAAEYQTIAQDQQVEYRDQDGNLLNEEQVQQLLKDDKVTFSTKYETKTKTVDELGNEVPEQYAPDHPDVEGQNPDTKGATESGKNTPADAEVSVGSSKDRDTKAKPASEAQDATKKE